MGDPCKLVGYSETEIQTMLVAGKVPDNKKWRLPTYDEQLTSINKTGLGYAVSSNNSLGVEYKGKNVTLTADGKEHVAFYPAAGYRDEANGTIHARGVTGYYWSSTARNEDNGYTIRFNASTDWFDNTTANPKQIGRAVRCVPYVAPPTPGTGDSGTVPAFNGVIAIGSDGRYTLEGESDDNARTVHFKYGSVIAIAVNVNKQMWSMDDVIFNPAGTQFGNWDAVTYESGNVNINGAYHTYEKVMAGKGDPCRLVGLDLDNLSTSNYDNGKWRLPTAAEYNNGTYGAKNYVNGWNQRSVTIDGETVVQPAVGYRESLYTIKFCNAVGSYITSNFSSTDNAYNFYYDGDATPEKNKEMSKNYGYAVRCVPQKVGTGKNYVVPAFDGVIALGSDGKLTVTAYTDGDSDARTLLFKYGGVIGSSCNDAWTPTSSQLAYNPSLTPDADFTNWKKVPTQSEVVADGTIVHTVASVKAGLGDPCRLVGYTPDEVRALLASNTVPDKGVWRTPSKNRYSHDNATVGDWVMSNQNSSGQPYGARLVNITNSSGVTHSALHPAAGCRKDTETGALELQGTDGYYWSTTANSAGEPGSGYALMFNNQYSGRDNSYIKDTGRAVRCIPK